MGIKNIYKYKYVCVLVSQSSLTLCNPIDCSLSMEFSRQEYWSGLFANFNCSLVHSDSVSISHSFPTEFEQ